MYPVGRLVLRAVPLAPVRIYEAQQLAVEPPVAAAQQLSPIMSSKSTTWSRSATIFSPYYVASVYERYVSNEKRRKPRYILFRHPSHFFSLICSPKPLTVMVYVPRLLEDDSFVSPALHDSDARRPLSQ